MDHTLSFGGGTLVVSSLHVLRDHRHDLSLAVASDTDDTGSCSCNPSSRLLDPDTEIFDKHDQPRIASQHQDYVTITENMQAKNKIRRGEMVQDQ